MTSLPRASETALQADQHTDAAAELATLRRLADAIPQLVWMAHADGHIHWYNRRWYEYTGTTFEQMQGWGWQSVHSPTELPAVLARWQACIATREPFEMVFPLRRHDGEFHAFLTRVEPEKDADGRVLGWFGTNTDISVQQRSEQLLRESEQRLVLALSVGHGIGTWDWDMLHDGVVADERFARLYGVEPEEARRGAPLAGFFANIHPDDAPRLQQIASEMRRTGGDFNDEYRIVHADGSISWVAAQGRCELAADGRPVHCRGVSFDITDRKLAETRLLELNADLERKVIERSQERGKTWQVSPDLMGALDARGYFATSNPAWQAVLGWPEHEVARMSMFEMVHPDDVEPTRGVFRLAQQGRSAIRFVNRCRCQGGGYRWISWVAVPDDGLVYCTGRDVTEDVERDEALKLAESALRQSQKMEAVGQLTGGLAHDFNNLLAGISGSLEIMQRRIAQGRIETVDRYLIAARGAVKRAAALTHRLLAFSRRQTLDPKPTNANRLIAGMEELVRRTVGPAVQLEVVGAGGLWLTLVDPSQLENALLNLCINARDAMPDGGRLTVETANKWLDDRAARARDLEPGQYVSLCVTDTGTGMAPEVIAHAFDPFFTTKPIGEGTGLGLSMVYGFARQSNGQVRIYSELGKGTTMCIYLPRHDGEDDAEDRAAPKPQAEARGDGEVVLVIDDEPTVRMLIAEVLEEAGYAAIEVSDGPAGLRVLQSDARIDLLITDVGLPGGMNGRQVADAARVARPQLKVLFITGYAENAAIGNGHLAKGMSIVTKPFAIDDLARKIKDMMVG